MKQAISLVSNYYKALILFLPLLVSYYVVVTKIPIQNNIGYRLYIDVVRPD